MDVLRGLVMVLMAVDHASEAFNAGRFFTDAAWAWKPGTPLPPGQFLTRWVTHLCAPTFVFLAGTALAISVAGRERRGATARAIDAHVAARGAILIGLELAWMSWLMLAPGRFLLQVLYAIGGSLLAMVALRRLGDRALAALGIAILFGGEAIAGALAIAGVDRALPSALLLTSGFFFDRRLIVAYPLAPWLGMMCLGWVLGRKLASWRDEAPARAAPALAAAGGVSLALFAVVRGVDRYGNWHLHRDDLAPLQWLHVSKYPPSVTYATLELGIMALLLAALFAACARRPGFAAPLRLLGQTALFFYLLHMHALHLVAWALGVEGKLGMGAAYAGGLGVTALLYPACAWYRRYKDAHPESWTRFV